MSTDESRQETAPSAEGGKKSTDADNEKFFAALA